LHLSLNLSRNKKLRKDNPKWRFMLLFRKYFQ
ncbi:hypothetical protein HAINFHK1212_1925, partial [Haemophilus influenzae HK1212]